VTFSLRGWWKAWAIFGFKPKKHILKINFSEEMKTI
jgi:hypothetical protein